ncbi:tyrosine-type recombinase/integrase [Paenibacillus cisolokensis]|uniref:tyrosine-type recombinase/integrase n=1 Tax=Paenibacillus cisolokensis TaxID=1658519 RepID=UPI003D2CF2C3
MTAVPKTRVTKLREHLPSTWEETLEQFLSWKRAQGISKTTLDDYRRHVGMFYRRYPDAFGSPPEQVESCLYHYLGDESIKPATYNLRLNYLRAFFKWCVDKIGMQRNPLEGFKKRKDEGKVIEVDEGALLSLLELPDRTTFTGLRDYALIVTHLDTGIRPKEAFSLYPSDFNPRSCELYVRQETAKTRVSRTLPLSHQTVKVIQELLDRRPKEFAKMPIFCSREGTPLTRFTWGDRMEHYSKMLGVKIRPYDLRHSYATMFLRGGGSPLALQRGLGHTDLTMTKRYVHLTNNDLKDQHALASPIHRLMPKKTRAGKLK